jgi:hypothetical protein
MPLSPMTDCDGSMFAAHLERDSATNCQTLTVRFGYAETVTAGEIDAVGQSLVTSVGTVVDLLAHQMEAWPDGLRRFAVEYSNGLQLDLVLVCRVAGDRPASCGARVMCVVAHAASARVCRVCADSGSTRDRSYRVPDPGECDASPPTSFVRSRLQGCGRCGSFKLRRHRYPARVTAPGRNG